MATKVRMKN